VSFFNHSSVPPTSPSPCGRLREGHWVEVFGFRFTTDTLHPAPYTLHPTPETTRNPKSGTRNLKQTETRNATPQELTVSYIGASNCKPRADRQTALADIPLYLGACLCSLCISSEDTPPSAQDALDTLFALRALQERFRRAAVRPASL
jgi:hypothetical protein